MTINSREKRYYLTFLPWNNDESVCFDLDMDKNSLLPSTFDGYHMSRLFRIHGC